VRIDASTCRRERERQLRDAPPHFAVPPCAQRALRARLKMKRVRHALGGTRRNLTTAHHHPAPPAHKLSWD
jgi:hypothetical protein